MFVHPAGSDPYLLPSQLKNKEFSSKKKNHMEFIIIIKLYNKIYVKISKYTL